MTKKQLKNLRDSLVQKGGFFTNSQKYFKSENTLYVLVGSSSSVKSSTLRHEDSVYLRKGQSAEETYKEGGPTP